MKTELEGSNNELLAIVTTIGRKAKGKTQQAASTLLSLAPLITGLFPLSRFPAFRFYSQL